MRLHINKEHLKKALLSLIGFAGCFLTMSLSVYSNSMFLAKIGAEMFPFVMLGSFVLVMIYAIFNSLYSNRIPATRTFAIINLFLAVASLSLMFFGQGSTIQITALAVISGFMFMFIDISILNIATALLTPLQAKSYVPLVNTFCELGIMLGAFSITRMGNIYEEIGINYLVAGVFALISMMIFILLRLFKKDIDVRKKSTKEARVSMKSAYRYVFRESQMFRTLAMVLLLIVAIQMFSEFRMKSILAVNYSGEELINLLGWVYFIQSASNFIINLVLTKPILYRFGVSKTMLSFPIMAMICISAAILTGFGPYPTIAYFLAVTIPYYTYMPVAMSQMFSLVPQKLTQPVYFFIKGIVAATGSIAAAALLAALSWDPFLSNVEITVLILAFLAILLIKLFDLKRYYFYELKDNLFREDRYLQSRAVELFAEKSQKESGELYLRRLLDKPELDEEIRIKAMHTIGIIGNHQSVFDLIQVMVRGTVKEKFAAVQAINKIIRSRKKFNRYPVTKHLLLKNFKEMFLTNVPMYLKTEIIASLRLFELDDVIDFLSEHLNQDDPEMRINVIETLGNFDDRAVITYIEPFLSFKDTKIVAAAVAALWKFEDRRIYLIPKVAKILSEPDMTSIESSFLMINAIRATWEKRYVLSRIDNPDRHIHIYALLTMVRLGEPGHIDALLKEWMSLARIAYRKVNILKAEGAYLSEAGWAMMAKAEIEFILSQYRQFDTATKEVILRKIQEMAAEDAGFMLSAFRESKFVFNEEVGELE